jgi:hypothetical protein
MCVNNLWKNITFNPATSKVIAIRSDGLIVPIFFPSGALETQKEMVKAFATLESFRNCKCSLKEVCNLHKEK